MTTTRGEKLEVNKKEFKEGVKEPIGYYCTCFDSSGPLSAYRCSQLLQKSKSGKYYWKGKISS